MSDGKNWFALFLNWSSTLGSLLYGDFESAWNKLTEGDYYEWEAWHADTLLANAYDDYVDQYDALVDALEEQIAKKAATCDNYQSSVGEKAYNMFGNWINYTQALSGQVGTTNM